MTQMTHDFEVETVDGVSVVTFHGPKILPEGQDALFGLLLDGPGRRVVLDLRHVCVLTSRALALIFGLKKKLDETAGKLRVCQIDPALRDMLHVTKLDVVLDIVETRDDALQGF